MSIARRGFVRAAFATIAGLFAMKPKPVANDGVTTLPTVAGFNPHTDKILTVVAGVIPVTPRYIPAVGPAITPALRPEDREPNKLWFEVYDDVSELPAGRYPRTSQFALQAEVVIGTVDQLVSHYRARLEHAVRTKFRLDQLGADPTPDKARQRSQEAQPKFAVLQQQMPDKQGVIQMSLCPAPTPHPAVKAFHERRLRCFGLDPTQPPTAMSLHRANTSAEVMDVLGSYEMLGYGGVALATLTNSPQPAAAG